MRIVLDTLQLVCRKARLRPGWQRSPKMLDIAVERELKRYIWVDPAGAPKLGNYMHIFLCPEEYLQN